MSVIGNCGLFCGGGYSGGTYVGPKGGTPWLTIQREDLHAAIRRAKQTGLAADWAEVKRLESVTGCFIACSYIPLPVKKTGVKKMQTCCLSMTTVNPTPGVCQNPCCCCGDGGAGNTSAVLNSVGKWGTSIAGLLTGRPVTATSRGVSVGPSAQYRAQGAAPNMTVIIVVVVVAGLLILFMRK